MRSPKATHEKRIAPIAATQIYPTPYKYAETEHAFFAKTKTHTYMVNTILNLRGKCIIAYLDF